MSKQFDRLAKVPMYFRKVTPSATPPLAPQYSTSGSSVQLILLLRKRALTKQVLLKAHILSVATCAPFRLMSLTTEVQTNTALEGLKHNNPSSISVRARSPAPHDQDVGGLRKLHPGKEEIELAELPQKTTAGSEADERGSVKAGSSSDEVKPASVRLTAWLQFSALCFTLFIAGWNDGTTGPLLPRIQSNYHVRNKILRFKSGLPGADIPIGIGWIRCSVPDLHL